MAEDISLSVPNLWQSRNERLQYEKSTHSSTADQRKTLKISTGSRMSMANKWSGSRCYLQRRVRVQLLDVRLHFCGVSVAVGVGWVGV
jgi:hypothetical protein